MDIDEIELRRLDLTILLVFLNLMRFRKASDVAVHMGLTQSSISHSIKRLREAFGDQLFLRQPRGMDPTAVAVALEPKIRAVVEGLTEALSRSARFDPTAIEGTVRIGAYDSEMATLVPDLIGRVKSAAPGLRISCLPLGRRQALAALERREIDLALGFIWDIPKDFISVEIYEESYRVVCRTGHPLVNRISDLDVYCAADHLVVSPAGDLSGIVDIELQKRGRSRSVVASMPLFLPALTVIADSDLVATLPSRLVQRHAALFGLAECEPPVTIRPFAVSTVRHVRDSNNPLHDWIIEQLGGRRRPLQLDSNTSVEVTA